MKASDIIGDGKKKAYRDARLVFKSDTFSTEVDCKVERLDPKKILPYEEYEQILDLLYFIQKVTMNVIG